MTELRHLRTLFGTAFLVTMLYAACGKAETSGRFYYAGYAARLNGYTSIYPLESVDDGITAASSEVGLDIHGDRWYKNLSLRAHSTNSLIPDTGGSSPDRTYAINKLTAMLNIPWPLGSFNRIRYTREEYWTHCEVQHGATHWVFDYDEARYLAPGDGADIGMVLDIFTLEGNLSLSEDKQPAQEDDSKVVLAFGAARVVRHGGVSDSDIRQTYLRTATTWTPVMRMYVDVKAGQTGDVVWGVQVPAEFMLGVPMGMKTGYLFTASTPLSNRLDLRASFGGYQWLSLTGGSGYNVYSTDLGWDAGLRVGYNW